MNADDLAANFRANVKHFRSHAGLSQRALGRKTEIPSSMISELETGATRPSLETLARIANALGVGAWILLSPPVEAGVKKPKRRE